MAIFTLLAASAAATAPLPSVEDRALFAGFKQVCSQVRDLRKMERAARKGKWQAVSEDANPQLAQLVRGGREAALQGEPGATVSGAQFTRTLAEHVGPALVPEAGAVQRLAAEAALPADADPLQSLRSAPKDSLQSVFNWYGKTTLQKQLKSMRENGYRESCAPEGYFLLRKGETSNFGLFEYEDYRLWIRRYNNKKIILGGKQFPKIYPTIYHMLNSMQWDYFMSNDYYYKDIRTYRKIRFLDPD